MDYLFQSIRQQETKSLEDAKEALSTYDKLYDIYPLSEKSRSAYKGWKLSIQGKTVDDGRELLDRLYEYLRENRVLFKIGTCLRYGLTTAADPSDKEQGHKAMTIYCPDDMDIELLAKEVADLLEDYEGHIGVKPPLSYRPYHKAVYIRNDRDPSGNYIYAN